jgi:hypothetical protein
MPFYSLPTPRVWRGEALRRETTASLPDPYSPSSPDYRQRTAETVTEVGNGLSRVDLGEPLKRLPGETQPIAVPQAPEEPPEAPEVTVRPEVATRTIASVLRSTKLPDWRPGLGRG